MGSGALITADAALDQGREVMAVPGPMTSPLSAGTNQLIRDGATPLLEAADVLRHFPEVAPRASDQAAPVPPRCAVRQLPATLSPAAREVALALGE